jgi:hypothetical protein
MGGEVVKEIKNIKKEFTSAMSDDDKTTKKERGEAQQ